MICIAPMPAWQTSAGDIRLGHQEKSGDRYQLRIACGKCIGCRGNKARAWALRCSLELQQHDAAAWTTLTYDDAPPTLHKPHLSGFLKRLRQRVARSRSARPIRFFACGEYGEQFGRPHYHAILYGCSAQDGPLIREAWGLGITDTYELTPAMISYTAGYTTKKLALGVQTYTQRLDVELGKEKVDRATGELYYVKQEPFLLMSRNPGLAAFARNWKHSWRSHAVLNGTPIPTPRYLHQAWKQIATAADIEQLNEEKLNRKQHNDTYTLNAQEAIYRKQQQMKADARNKM